MQVQSMNFKARATEKLADVRLQSTLAKVKGNFIDKRAKAITQLDDFEGTRQAAVAIRDNVLNNLDVWLEAFEKNAIARGATVYWAENAEEVNRLVIDIARRHDCKKAIKAKSMVSEETALNDALTAAGITPIETDLGEYVVQISHSTPSHIIAPIVHLSKEEVSELFEKIHHLPRKTDITEMTHEARGILRPHFLDAEMGISGGNFFIAETGSVALFSNEGNIRMSTTMPKVHVAISGIEKVVPTLEDFSTLARLLPRSATGQSISNYVSLLTGPHADDELDGPEHMYFILVDNGRTGLVGSDLQEMLRCIRCGACMNHCPVYHHIGGHAYGWVYPGPMGSVLTPAYVGIENAIDLPNASTLCGECHVVCPVKIPLPDLLRKLREKQVDRKLRPMLERIALTVWSWAAQRPAFYAFGSKIAMRMLSKMSNKNNMIENLPFGAGWSAGRDFPAPAGRTFRELYAEKNRRATPSQTTATQKS
ncbi:MAG: LutB/LldF family L-lactate oxidation iron-sulfur protein [Burkholderiales bacterium]